MDGLLARVEDELVLAETPQPEGGVVVVILVILLGVLVAHVAVVVRSRRALPVSGSHVSPAP